MQVIRLDGSAESRRMIPGKKGRPKRNHGKDRPPHDRGNHPVNFRGRRKLDYVIGRNVLTL